MKSHNPIWWIWLVFFLLPEVKPVFGQQAGELDTSFANRPNYGALRPVEKAWALADGSVLCFQEGENYFSGKKTGSFFKIRPDGNLDSSYSTPVILFPCFVEWCTCDFYINRMDVSPDGEVLLICGGSISMNGELQNKYIFRFNSQGAMDGNTPQIPNLFFGNEINSVYQPFLLKRRILYWTEDSMQLYTYAIKRDSLFKSAYVPWASEFPYKTLVQSKDINYVVVMNNSLDYKYFPLKSDSIAFSTPIIPAPISGIKPYPIEIDRWGRIYERYTNLDTLGGALFNRIMRRNQTGLLDSSYIARIPAIDSDMPNFDGNQQLKVDSLGRIWQYRRGGKVLNGSSYSTNASFPWYVNYNTRIEGGWFWRYDADSGAFLDSVYQEPFEHRFLHQNEQIVMGPDDQNRWYYSRRQPDGTEIFQKVTRFGANGPISTVLADQQGRAIILGDFTHFDAHISPRIARVLKNGLADTSFRCRMFETGMPPAPLTFSFWRNDPSQGFLMVSSKPCGGLNRFLYHILPNGDIDSSFASPDYFVFETEVTEVLAAGQDREGSMMIGLRLDITDSTRYSFLTKLTPLGGRDSSFPMRTLHHFIPGAPGVQEFQGPYIRNIIKMSNSHWVIGYQRNEFWNDPPCRPETENTMYSYYGAFSVDSNGVGTGNFVPEVPSMEFSPSQNQVESSLFIGQYGNVFPGPEVHFYKLKPNLSLDSSFRLRYPNGAPGSDTAYVRHRRAYLQTSRGDYFFSSFKTNPEGIFDTTFRFRCPAESLAEPDTNHLYMAGGFQFFGEKVAPYLVRVHNRTSVVTALSDLRKSSQVVLYPNPVGETVHIAGWKPGMVLRITSVEGKILFEGTVSQECASATLGLGRGLYFWSASHRGQPVGGGRLIR